MAHPCYSCGSECFCHGDMDDAVVCLTPQNCEGCGGELCADEAPDTWDDDDYHDCGEDTCVCLDP